LLKTICCCCCCCCFIYLPSSFNSVENVIIGTVDREGSARIHKPELSQTKVWRPDMWFPDVDNHLCAFIRWRIYNWYVCKSMLHSVSHLTPQIMLENNYNKRVGQWFFFWLLNFRKSFRNRVKADFSPSRTIERVLSSVISRHDFGHS